MGGFQNPGVCLQAFPSFLPHPLPALLLTPFFARSLTLAPHSLLLNRTETLATQAKLTQEPTPDVFVAISPAAACSLLSVNYCWGQWTTGVVIELLCGHWTDCLFWTIFAHKTHHTKNKVYRPLGLSRRGKRVLSQGSTFVILFLGLLSERSARHSKVQQQQRALFAWPYRYIQCCKSYFKNQNYVIGKLRYFGTVICHEDQSKLKYIFMNH